ncbi:MAG: hypothetical protein M3Y82_09735 [Verrucomicrobiota bacterium]|nr:hypothetical protein [Verrucomicrobiota bacterium]
MIEILIVVAIMGIILAMGVPSFVRSLRKEGMRKAVEEITEACGDARANAILTGAPAELIIHPKTGGIEVSSSSAPSEGENSKASKDQAVPFSATLPENIFIELLGVNFVELQDADVARVKFYPNGTSDEFTILIRSDRGEMRKISLEIVTALADVEVVK